MDKPFHEIEPADPPEQLTDQEREVYDFIREYVRKVNHFPGYRELMDRFDWKYPNSAAQSLKKLYSKGWIDRQGRGQWKFTQGKCPYCNQEIR